MPCGWKVTVDLARCQRLLWYIQLRAHSLEKADEHPSYTPHTLPYIPHNAQHSASKLLKLNFIYHALQPLQSFYYLQLQNCKNTQLTTTKPKTYN